jgi:hypothetical protein
MAAALRPVFRFGRFAFSEPVKNTVKNGNAFCAFPF